MFFDMTAFFADLDEIMDSNPLPGTCNGWEPSEHADHTETEAEGEILQ